MKIILKQGEINPVKDDARFNETAVKGLVQHQGRTYRVLNYVRRLTPCECFIRRLAWALSCITIIPIIFWRASVSRFLNEARTKSERKIVYAPIDLQTAQEKFNQLKRHIEVIEKKPAFINLLVKEGFSLENHLSLKKWLKARDTLVVWTKIAMEAKIQEGALDICGFPDAEATVEKASKFGVWCAQNANEIAKINELRIINSQLTYLPKEVGNLSQLRIFYLTGNQLIRLPKEVGKLSQLTELTLSYNQLTDLPGEFGNLSQLTYLDLTNNRLNYLPKEVGNLSQLTNLYLVYNQLTHLPNEVGNLSQLKELTVSYNQLTHLPGEVGNLSQLTFLNLAKNPLSGIPQEIANLENRGCIIYWWV